MEPNMNFTYRDSKNVEHTISFEEKDFALSQYDIKLSDEKMKSKPTTFFKDALHRFSKNKSSVAGAIILHERLSGREYLGCALMLAAVFLSQLPEKRAKSVENKDVA